MGGQLTRYIQKLTCQSNTKGQISYDTVQLPSNLWRSRARLKYDGTEHDGSEFVEKRDAIESAAAAALEHLMSRAPLRRTSIMNDESGNEIHRASLLLTHGTQALLVQEIDKKDKEIKWSDFGGKVEEG